MNKLTRADLAELESGDRLLVKDYDPDGEEEYRDYEVQVVEVGREGKRVSWVVWHLEHLYYDHEEELNGEAVEELVRSLYRL